MIKRGPHNTGKLIENSSGFSLFELVVYIIAVAIIYATAANRFSQFPAEAERANFTAVMAQLQSAINLEMMLGLGQGRPEAAEKMAGRNPMEFLLEAPTNYIGAFDAVDEARLGRRIWYFDRRAGELVYLIENRGNAVLFANGVERPTNQIRLHLEAEYRIVDAATGMLISDENTEGEGTENLNTREEFVGIILKPVVPFRWKSIGSVDISTVNSS